MNPPHAPLMDEPLPRPRRWGAPEMARLAAMLEQDSLFYWNGQQTVALLGGFRELYPLEYAFACSSGSAAIHIAIAALRLKPGDEVIVPPITDMGTVIGILYQQCVPIFADLDPATYNLDPADVRRRISSRTRAIIAVHLAGNPCDVSQLQVIAREHNLALIEDCAQAWGARAQGAPVGLAGNLACYSLNQHKHVTCGDGGIVATNDLRYGPGLGKWGDKHYDRMAGGRDPEELAPNYRISEPQSAVAAAQLKRLPEIAARRSAAGDRLTALLSGTPGLRLPRVNAGDTSSYWFYLVRVEAEKFRVTRNELAASLAAEGVACQAGYIPRPIYQYPVFRNHNFFGGQWPIRDLGLTSVDYRNVSCPVAEEILRDCIIFTLNEAMSDSYIDKLAHAIRAGSKRSLK
ncbi:MAG: glutamine--scyllo-inositol aminotransferase [Verrucomicrobia bacterium]|nr:glutamine--scyllo-inositol aminotransferase [Verrucomicrobiota bacterium]